MTQRKSWKKYGDELYPALLSSAQKYKTLSLWRKGDPSAYRAAYIRGMTLKVALDMKWKSNPVIPGLLGLTGKSLHDAIKQRARDMISCQAFLKHDRPAFELAVAEGFLEDLKKELGDEWVRDFDHFSASTRRNRSWKGCSAGETESRLVEIAQSFSSAKEWREKDNSSYKVALETGFQIAKHFKNGCGSLEDCAPDNSSIGYSI